MSLLLVLASPPATAELPLPSLKHYFASYNRGERPGAAVLVLRDGKVLHRQGYGLADLKRRQAITPRTAFDLASLSKQFTALGVAMLAEQGRLSYDDPVEPAPAACCAQAATTAPSISSTSSGSRHGPGSVRTIAAWPAEATGADVLPERI